MPLFFWIGKLSMSQLEIIWPEISEEEKRLLVDGEHPDSPFYRFVGNENAIKKLKVAAYTALGRKNHVMNELAFSIFGPSSAGKTTLARCYSDVVELPYVEISPKSVKTLEDIILHVEPVLESDGVPLCSSNNKFTLPPCIIFIDEVHALSNYLIQGLLKATEYKDGILVTESKNIYCCKKVTWFIATTDEGRLFDAFRTRFTPIELKYLRKSEISRIVKLSFPNFDDHVCDLIAHYNSRVPRKALEFARYTSMYVGMHSEYSFEEAVHVIAEEEGIDEYGMRFEHLQILKALKDGPVSKSRIGVLVNKKDEEIERFVMPWLLAETDDQKALVTISTKGYTITEAGVEELKKRNST